MCWCRWLGMYIHNSSVYGHLTSYVWISCSGSKWSSWCMKPLWKQETSSLELTIAAGTIADMPGIIEQTRQWMVRRCTVCIQANGHCVHTGQWPCIRAVPVNAIARISMLNYFLYKSSLASEIAVKDHMYHSEIYLFWCSLHPVLIWTNSFGTFCICNLCQSDIVL